MTHQSVATMTKETYTTPTVTTYGDVKSLTLTVSTCSGTDFFGKLTIDNCPLPGGESG